MSKTANQYKKLIMGHVELPEGTIVLVPAGRKHVFQRWHLEGPATVYINQPVYARKKT